MIHLNATTTRTFQHIYDFCHSDATFRRYYDCPDQFRCSDRRQYRYYHSNLGRGLSRCGSYLFMQARNQLERFLRSDCTDFYFHLDPDTGQVVDVLTNRGRVVYIVAHIDGSGVRISFTHPFYGLFEEQRVFFTARSHRPFTEEGIRDEVIDYLLKHILLPPGPDRDLQIRYRVPKDEFVGWHLLYRITPQAIAALQEWTTEARKKGQSVMEYAYERAYYILSASGIFDKLKIKPDNRERMTRYFINHYNKLCNGTIL